MSSSPLRFLQSLTTSTSLYGSSAYPNSNDTNFVLLRNILLFSLVGALFTPEKHSLLTSAISWATVTIVCVFHKQKGDGRTNTTAMWRAGAATVHGVDKKARRKITLLVACILLSGISERASEQGWAERESWWAKAALPPTIQFLRTYVFGDPGILETSTRPSRKVTILITIISFFTLLPKYISRTSYALGLCNIAITSFAYVLFEDVTPTMTDRGLDTAIDFDAVVASGLSTIAGSCTVGFIIAGIFYDSKLYEQDLELQVAWVKILIAGFVGGAKWLLIPLLVSRFSATSAGSVDLSSALFAGLVYPLPSFTHVLGTLVALGGMVSMYLPLISKEHTSVMSAVKFGPTRSLLGIFLIFILISSLFIFQPTSLRPKKPHLPSPELDNPMVHPVRSLIQDAGNRFEELKSRQSTTLLSAVKHYKKRYNMNPPPNFDKWYEFAVSKKSVLIDEYDTIYHSLLPFWGLPPKMIRARAREALGFEQALLGLSIRNGDVLEVKGGEEWSRDATVGMIEQFKQYLPDMDLAFNTHDEPRVVVPHDELSALVERGLDTNRKIDTKNQYSGFPADESGKIPATNETRFNAMAHQPIWDVSRVSCPPDSPSRALLEDGVDATDQWAIQPMGFMKNLTAFKEICLQPSLKDRFGFFQRPNAFRAAHTLFPIFSQSKVSCFNDIIYPSPWYWAGKVSYDESKDVKWNDKQGKMFWRGSTTGGYSRLSGWKKQHRQRVVTVINADDTCKVLEQVPVSRNWRVVEKERKDFRDLFDVYFSHVGQCDDADCEEQRRFFDIKEMTDQQDAWKCKHLIDIDGNAFSGRFYAFLQSYSAVFKLSIFKEWHEEWLVPWVHFVPLSLQMDETVELMRYFTKEQTGQDDIKRIAEEGRRWANKVLRKEDFEVWFFRLLLEYGRVIDDNRENIGYIP